MMIQENTQVAVSVPAKTVRLEGRLDASAIERRQAELAHEIAGRNAPVVLNLAAVSFIDSTGLGFLVSVHKQLEAAGNRLAICELSDQARLLFELTRLNQIFDLYDSEALAVQALR